MRSRPTKAQPLWLLLAAWLACAHTHQATDKPEPDSAPSQPKPSSVERHRQVDKSLGKDPKRASASSLEGAPPVSSSPTGLLREDAIERIQGRLEVNGYLQHKDASGKLDGRTKEALRAFQRDRNLPATGIPDDETVRQLGLSADHIFRNSSPAKS
jgi:hypothetical protein